MEFFGDLGSGAKADTTANGMDPDLLGSFIQELEETITNLEQKIIEVESNPNDMNLINSLFRAFHNLKGSSTMVGLKTLPELMHFAESVLDQVRNSRLPFDSEITNALLEVFTAMREIRENLKASSSEGKSRYFTVLAALEQLGKKAESSNQKPSEENRDNSKPSHEEKGEDDEFIKITRSLVEQLMLVVGDFMLVESSFQYMKDRYSSDWTFIENCQQLAHFSNKLQNTVLRMRLSPIKPIFSSMHRVARSTAGEVGKKVAMEVNGADTLVDRSILDVIGDPIMHMVRNSIDHGIEKPADRVANGKPEEGQVTLSAFHKAGEVVIQISDDGRGIDPKRVAEKAVAKGFLTEEEAAALSPAEASQLIFLPGFSGAEQVTSVSGRGVGMDVVKQVVVGLGGQVDLMSNPGAGTTLSLRLPLSMAISECLEFRLGEKSYAVSQLCIEEVFSAESPLVRDHVHSIHGGSRMLMLRDVPTPVLDLAGIFGIEAKADESLHYIQVRHGHTRFALCVGNIIGPCNIVCQPLPNTFAADAPFSGMTRRGDGSLMFQVDVGRLCSRLHLHIDAKSSTGAKIRGGTTITSSDLRRLQQKIAIFRNYEFFCIPVQDIKQVVSVPAGEVHVVADHSYITLGNSTVPLVWIEEVLLKKKRIELENYSILIYQVEDKTFGMPMGEFGGIIRMPVEYDNSVSSHIITGSTIIEGETCLVVDLFGLTREAYHAEVASRTRQPAKIKRLAIAEDDPFFREQLLAFLRARELTCVDFPDGQSLKEWLSKPENVKEIDAVLTDIEMPRMDGLTLTRWVKGTEGTKHLPCLIITSLTNKEVIRLAISAGASAFIPKMQHQQVMQELKKIESGLEKMENDKRFKEPVQTSSARVVTFTIGNDIFALPMECLKEVSHVSPGLPVPDYPEHINRITAFRGRMIPVIDFSKLFQLSGEIGPSRQQAIVEWEGTVIALLFDAIGEVLLLSQLTYGEGFSKASAHENHMSQFLKGIFQKDSKLISLIDPMSLVAVCQQTGSSRKNGENAA